jgi:hypothetical protein
VTINAVAVTMQLGGGQLSPIFINEVLVAGAGSYLYTEQGTATTEPNLIPDQFTFIDQGNVPLSTFAVSAPITVSGLTPGFSTLASILGDATSEYRINGGAWITATASVNNGNTIEVRHQSSGLNSFNTNTTLALGPLGQVTDTFTSTTLASGASQRVPWPMGTTYIQSGHSLTDLIIGVVWPGRLITAVMLDPAGDFFDIGDSTTPGASIEWRWNNPETVNPKSAEWPADMPNYQGLVITPRVPLTADDAARQTEQVDWLLIAAQDAWTNGNGGAGAPTLLYTTWSNIVPVGNGHPEDNFTFREKLDFDEPRWEAMMDFVNANVPAGQVPMYMIPAHRLMMRVWDDIELGVGPFTNISDIFSDSIHCNEKGQYALTLMHYSCIYGRSSAAYLPDTLLAEDTVTPTESAYFKSIVDEIIVNYSRTGLTSLAVPGTFVSVAWDGLELRTDSILVHAHGQHNGLDNQSSLTDSTASFGVDTYNSGFTLRNISKDATADITDTTDTNLVGTLSGGADWDTGNYYQVVVAGLEAGDLIWYSNESNLGGVVNIDAAGVPSITGVNGTHIINYYLDDVSDPGNESPTYSLTVTV